VTIEQGPSFDPKSFLAKVGEGRSIGTYRKDRIVFTQGEVADSVFYIQKGKVKVTVISEQGKEAVVALLGPDEFCGRRMATATAMTECEIMRLEKEAVVRILHDEPAFSEMWREIHGLSVDPRFPRVARATRTFGSLFGSI
jgi:CRP/FNR family cyclic AMP-dependent transcriptional regulator